MEFRYVTVPVKTERGSIFAISEHRFAVLSHITRDIICIKPGQHRHLNLDRFRPGDQVWFSYGKEGDHATFLALLLVDEQPENLSESMTQKEVEIKLPMPTIKPRNQEGETNCKDADSFYGNKKRREQLNRRSWLTHKGVNL